MQAVHLPWTQNCEIWQYHLSLSEWAWCDMLLSCWTSV